MEAEFVKIYALSPLNWLGLNPFCRGWFSHVRVCFLLFCLCGPLIINMKNISESFVLVLPSEQVIFKTISTFFLGKTIKEIIRKMELFWPSDIYGEELKQIVNTTNLKFRKAFQKYLIVFVGATIVYVLNLAVVNFRFIYPKFTFSGFLMYLWQESYILSLGVCYTLYDSLFFTLLHCGIVQMEKIRYGLKNCNVHQPNAMNSFVQIIKYHNFLLGYVTDLNRLYCMQLLNQFVTAAGCICFGIFVINMDGFPPATEKLHTSLPYLLCHTLQLFVYCYSGQKLYEQLDAVHEDIYNCNWYLKHNKDIANGMKLIMLISKRSNRLTIGKFWDLNLRTYMSVIKTSFTFNAFMQTVYQKG